MKTVDVKDKPWTVVKMGGLKGAYCVHDDKVQVSYNGQERRSMPIIS